MTGTEKKWPPPLVEMAMGYFRGRTLCAAARLGIADSIGDGHKSVDQLASDCRADSASLYRLLRALASFGILQEASPRSFVLTALGSGLRKDRPSSEWADVVFWGDLLADSWSHLTECVRSGEPAWATAQRGGITLRLAKDPEAGAIFRAVMGTAPAEDYAPLARAWDFSNSQVVADLGGGGGALLRAVLKNNPAIRGILVDRRDTLTAAAQHFAAEGLESRCTMISADLRESVPSGASVQLLKNVLHAYADDVAVSILKNCRAVLPSDGRLLIFEFVMPDVCDTPDTELEQRAMSDLNMLAVTGGKERSALEFREILRQAGFRVNAILAIPGTSASLVDASLAG